MLELNPGRVSNRNPLDLNKRDLISRAVIEFGGPRAFMRSHRLSVLQRAAGLKGSRQHLFM